MMLGSLVYIIFMVLGFFIAGSIDRKQPFYIRFWLGLIFGTMGMMWSVIPFAFFLNFNLISNLLGLSLFTSIAYFMVHNSNKINNEMEPILLVNKNIKKIEAQKEQSFLLKAKSLLNFSWDENFTALIWLTVPLVILIMYLAFNHILFMKPDGIYSGQSTFGDLPMHLGFITSIAEQGMFPPIYSIDPAVRLSYPFLVDSLSSSLMIYGDSLWLSILFPTFIMVLSLVMGFFIFSYEIIKSKGAAIMAAVLFFINGGLGFFYFLEANYINISEKSELTVVKGNLLQNLGRMVTEYYHTATNLNELNIRWSNVICDMIIPQRTTLAGFTVVLVAFWLLYKAIITNQRKFYISAGICGGLLPMIHTHSFLAFGIIAGVWGLIFIFNTNDKVKYIINWFSFGIPALIISMPQLFYWTFTQSTGEGFLKQIGGWASIPQIGNESQVWFWVKNIGIVVILLLPAMFASGKKMLMLYSGPIVLFIMANLIQFQPNPYDNNKLFYIWFMFSVILVSSYVWNIFNHMKGIRARWMLVALVILVGTLSGTLTIAREFKSGGEYIQFDKQQIEAADYIKNNTYKDSKFLTSRYHLNPVTALAGRNIVIGPELYLYWHGISSDVENRDVATMYAGGDKFKSLSEKYDVDYVYFGYYENNANESYFSSIYPKAFGNDNITIYAISPRAIKLLN